MSHWLQAVYWQYLGYFAELAIKFPEHYGSNGLFWEMVY